MRCVSVGIGEGGDSLNGGEADTSPAEDDGDKAELISSANGEVAPLDFGLDLFIGHFSYLLCGGEFCEDGTAPPCFQKTARPSAGVLHPLEGGWGEIEAALPVRVDEKEVDVNRSGVPVNRTEPGRGRGEHGDEPLGGGCKLLAGQVSPLLQTDNEMARFPAPAPVVVLHKPLRVEDHSVAEPIPD